MKTADLICGCSELWKAADMMKSWDEGLFRHSLAVADLTYEVGRRMGFAGEELERLRLGAFLHDIGKVRWPRYMVYKRDLTADDLQMIRDHPRYGAAYASELIPGVHPDVLRIIREHHERSDGSGYPDGLRDGEISPLSRVVAAVECFVALVEPREYRDAPFSVEEALESAAGCGCDPAVLDVVRVVFEGCLIRRERS